MVVDGYAAAPGETAIATTYDEYLVDATATLGSFNAEPDPVAVKQGETTSYDAVWSGLDHGSLPRDDGVQRRTVADVRHGVGALTGH